MRTAMRFACGAGKFRLPMPSTRRKTAVAGRAVDEIVAGLERGDVSRVDLHERVRRPVRALYVLGRRDRGGRDRRPETASRVTFVSEAFSAQVVQPIASTDVRTPTRMAACWARGVEPTR